MDKCVPYDSMYYAGLDEKFAAALTGLMVKEIYKDVLFEVTSAGSSRVSLQLYDDK